MQIIKILIILNLILILSSCGTIKKGFKNQKKNSNDEFLVEKKSPLVMPPDYNELPIPKMDKKEDNLKENQIKKLIIDDENKSSANTKNPKSKNLEDSLLEKIKKN